ncbi:hypothetical protein ATO5_08955 [Loktanella sp. 22II-4b]|nr:hypothetical protein ATO5_08955 [Loktanella sp. 22II-4b]
MSPRCPPLPRKPQRRPPPRPVPPEQPPVPMATRRRSPAARASIRTTAARCSPISKRSIPR